MNLRLFEAGLYTFILLFTGLFSLLIPSLTRRDLLFGVTVAPDARASTTGRRIIAGYRLAIGALTVVLLAALAAVALTAPDGWIASPWLAFGLIAAIFIQEIPYLFAYRASAWLRAPTGSHAPASNAPAAELRPRRYGDYVPLFWELLPVAIIAGTIAYLATQYASAPASIPIHFDAAGNPNGNASKSVGSYFALVWTQLGLEVLITGLSLLVVGSKAVPGRAETRFRRVWLRALYGIKTLLLAVFAFIAVEIAHAAVTRRGPAIAVIVAPLAVVVIVMVGVVVLAVRTGQGGARLGPPAETATDRTDDRHWFLGVIYHNRSDPAIFVERRFGVGWTFNIANPRAILVLLLILAVPIGAATISIVASRR